jgi:hypothetical protein
VKAANHVKTLREAKTKSLPKAVQRNLSEFDQTAEDLRNYVTQQRATYDSIVDKNTGFLGWMQLKLSCKAADARTIYKWATGDDIDKTI